jgi:nucleoside-diphosphate-sugar epimerase
MRAFISGGCGQVGSHIAELLLDRGDTVLAIDNLATGRLEHLVPQQRLTFVEGSIADRPLVGKLIGEFKPDVLIHTAASYKDPDDWYNDTLTNCVGSANLIHAAKDHKVGRFIYFQTALCYGVKPLQHPIRLDHPKFPANSSYAISKTAAEDYLEISGLDYVTFRLANVIGPRNVSGPLPLFYQRLSQGKRCFRRRAATSSLSAIWRAPWSGPRKALGGGPIISPRAATSPSRSSTMPWSRR